MSNRHAAQALCQRARCDLVAARQLRSASRTNGAVTARTVLPRLSQLHAFGSNLSCRIPSSWANMDGPSNTVRDVKRSDVLGSVQKPASFADKTWNAGNPIVFASIPARVPNTQHLRFYSTVGVDNHSRDGWKLGDPIVFRDGSTSKESEVSTIPSNEVKVSRKVDELFEDIAEEEYTPLDKFLVKAGPLQRAAIREFYRGASEESILMFEAFVKHQTEDDIDALLETFQRAALRAKLEPIPHTDILDEIEGLQLADVVPSAGTTSVVTSVMEALESRGETTTKETSEEAAQMNGSRKKARQLVVPEAHKKRFIISKQALSQQKAKDGKKAKYFSHYLYRHHKSKDKKVKVVLASGPQKMEKYALEFMNEPVVGFDMEWSQNKGKVFQKTVSIIQIARDDLIVLFQLAALSQRNFGSAAKLSVLPNLRKLIESPDVLKVGVAISCDGTRIKNYLNWSPRGLLDLGHFHHVVTAAKNGGEQKIPKTTVALAKLTERYLELPLYKGKVRTSNWSKDLSHEQIEYAAADAYAGLKIYQAIDDARLELDPVPDLPAIINIEGEIATEAEKEARKAEKAQRRKEKLEAKKLLEKSKESVTEEKVEETEEEVEIDEAVAEASARQLQEDFESIELEVEEEKR